MTTATLRGLPGTWSAVVRSRASRQGVRGFTLIEALVTIVLVALALVGIFGGIRAVTSTEARAREADLMQRLAAQKFGEFGVVTDPNTADNSGTFEEEGYSDVDWTLEVEPSDTLNVTKVTVTVTRGKVSQAVTGLVYVRPVAAAAGAQ